jgi:hypothetical protein
MTIITVNSDTALQEIIGEIREKYDRFRYLRVTIKTGKDRSIKQNNVTHRWYEQIARELREDDVIGWRCYCKLHHAVGIMRAEDEEFRTNYDAVVRPMKYEDKLLIMRFMPVTSLMTKDQLTRYAEQVQADFRKRGVILKFTQDE